MAWCVCVGAFCVPRCGGGGSSWARFLSSSSCGDVSGLVCAGNSTGGTVLSQIFGEDPDHGSSFVFFLKCRFYWGAWEIYLWVT